MGMRAFHHHQWKTLHRSGPQAHTEILDILAVLEKPGMCELFHFMVSGSYFVLLLDAALTALRA